MIKTVNGVSTLFVYDEDGHLLGKYNQTGKAIQETVWVNDTPVADGVKFAYNLRFPGQLYDAETRRHYNYFRDYNPNTGRYVLSDPIEKRVGSGLKLMHLK